MRVSSTASANWFGSRENPGASTAITAGVNSSASASSTSWLANSSVKMRSPNNVCRLRSTLGANARVGRHEGGVESALGKNSAEMIWQPQRDQKCIRHRPRAEDRRQHDVADESGHARQQGEAADGQDAVDHAAPIAREGQAGRIDNPSADDASTGDPPRPLALR